MRELVIKEEPITNIEFNVENIIKLLKKLGCYNR
jgi:hypothetical protein